MAKSKSSVIKDAQKLITKLGQKKLETKTLETMVQDYEKLVAKRKELKALISSSVEALGTAIKETRRSLRDAKSPNKDKAPQEQVANTQVKTEVEPVPAPKSAPAPKAKPAPTPKATTKTTPVPKAQADEASPESTAPKATKTKK